MVPGLLPSSSTKKKSEKSRARVFKVAYKDTARHHISHVSRRTIVVSLQSLLLSLSLFLLSSPAHLQCQWLLPWGYSYDPPCERVSSFCVSYTVPFGVLEWCFHTKMERMHDVSLCLCVYPHNILHAVALYHANNVSYIGPRISWPASTRWQVLIMRWNIHIYGCLNTLNEILLLSSQQKS